MLQVRALREPVERLGEPVDDLLVVGHQTRVRGEPNAYNRIRIAATDRAEVEVRAWDGARFTTAAVTPYERVDRVWRRRTTPQ